MRQVAIEPSLQGQGIGSSLIKYSELVARKAVYTSMVLHARDTAVPFYQKLGYQIEGDLFEEVGIPHYAMRKQLA
jgi:predicted GNAT family N-acyltransferase